MGWRDQLRSHICQEGRCACPHCWQQHVSRVVAHTSCAHPRLGLGVEAAASGGVVTASTTCTWGLQEEALCSAAVGTQTAQQQVSAQLGQTHQAVYDSLAATAEALAPCKPKACRTINIELFNDEQAFHQSTRPNCTRCCEAGSEAGKLAKREQAGNLALVPVYAGLQPARKLLQKDAYGLFATQLLPKRAETFTASLASNSAVHPSAPAANPRALTRLFDTAIKRPKSNQAAFILSMRPQQAVRMQNCCTAT